MPPSIAELLATPRLGQLLLDDLRALCPTLPGEGIVAGQAVASMILRRLGRPGPVNDIDVFDIRPLHWTEEYQPGGHKAYAATGEIGRSDEEEYVETLMNSHREFYARIGAVSRVGLLNRIEYQLEERDGEACDVLALIAGNFDLNCVQVGVDLLTGRLSYTDAFRQYLHSNQLVICNGNTPMASLARLARKTNELGAYSDFKGEARFAAACTLLFGAGNGRKEAADYVGERTYQKILPQLGMIKPWIRLAPMSAFSLQHRMVELDSGDNAYQTMSQVVTRGAPFRLYRAYLNHGLEQEILERPSSCPWIRIETRHGKHMAMLGNMPLGLMEFSVIDRLFRNGAVGMGKLKKLHTVLGQARRPALSTCLVDPLLYVRDNVTKASVMELNRFFSEHPGIVRNLMGLSHEEQIGIKRALKGRERRGERWAVGAVETAHLWMDEPVGPAIVRDGLDAFLVRYEQLSKTLASGPLRDGLTRLPLFEIRSLETAEALNEEGREMGHCVGGFGYLLTRPGNHFFSIRFKLGKGLRHRSTLHIGIDAKPLQWQHLSVGNEPATLANEIAARIIRDRLRACAEGTDARAWPIVREELSKALRQRMKRAKWIRPRRLPVRVQPWEADTELR